MAYNSLTGHLAIGKQADYDTQATAFIKTLATTSGMDVTFDETQPRNEHPSSVAGTSYLTSSTPKRTGYLTPWTADFVWRPRFFPRALQALGFAVTTSAGPEAGTYSHVCRPATDAAILWVSVIHNIGGAGEADRRALNGRASALNITGTNQEFTYSLTGTALKEANPSGTPTFTTEVDEEFSPSIGTFTCNLGASGTITEFRGLTANIAQVLKEDQAERPMLQAFRSSLDRESIDLTGEIQGVDFHMDLWTDIIRNGGSEPSLVTSTGDLNYSFSSASDIGATATPYSVACALPSVLYSIATGQARNNGKDLVRSNIGYRIVAAQGVTNPITYTVINDVATY